MDYHDCIVGTKNTSFWFRGKIDLIKYLLKDQSENNKILVIGAGTGDDLIELSKFGEIYATDIDKNALKKIPKSLCKEIILADSTKLPYNENIFDIVFSLDVFEHIKNDKKAIKEVYRVLRPNGCLIFNVPAYQFLFSGHDVVLKHYRRYSKKQVQKLLSVFKVKRLFMWNTFLFPIIAVHRFFSRLRTPKQDVMNLPRFIDEVFYLLIKLEFTLIRKGVSFPFGLSIAGIAEK